MCYPNAQQLQMMSLSQLQSTGVKSYLCTSGGVMSTGRRSHEESKTMLRVICQPCPAAEPWLLRIISRRKTLASTATPKQLWLGWRGVLQGPGYEATHRHQRLQSIIREVPQRRLLQRSAHRLHHCITSQLRDTLTQDAMTCALNAAVYRRPWDTNHVMQKMPSGTLARVSNLMLSL